MEAPFLTATTAAGSRIRRNISWGRVDRVAVAKMGIRGGSAAGAIHLSKKPKKPAPTSAAAATTKRVVVEDARRSVVVGE